MKELKITLNDLRKNSKGNNDIITTIENEKSLFPFSVESRLLAYYLSIGEITFDEYSSLHSDYCERNKYLELFEMAPRTYGQTWGEQHIRTLFPQFIKATKENLFEKYPNFDGEFDLLLDNIRIEVKACRANSTKSRGSLASRAYLHSEAKAKGFKYHFQQIKPSCCDVFICIGTCRDKLLYWVFTSDELIKTGKLGSQHRNENTGIAGTKVFEGQVFMTEDELSPFLVEEQDILRVVRQKSQRST